VKLHYEVFGDSRTTLLLLPTWTIVRSRFGSGPVAERGIFTVGTAGFENYDAMRHAWPRPTWSPERRRN
jgi:hypothetical protein